MVSLHNVLFWWKEVQQFSRDPVSPVVVLSITCYQFYNYTVQAQKIWRAKSAESVSITNFVSLLFLSIGAGWYGLESHVLSLCATTLLVWPTWQIVHGLWRFGTPTHFHKAVVGVYVFGLLLYVVLPTELVYDAFSVVGATLLSLQAWKLWGSRARGTLHLGWLWLLVVKNVAYIAIGWTVGSWVLKIFCPIYLTLCLLIIVLWYFRCRPASNVQTSGERKSV